jgi:hypothetical protein
MKHKKSQQQFFYKKSRKTHKTARDKENGFEITEKGDERKSYGRQTFLSVLEYKGPMVNGVVIHNNID